MDIKNISKYRKECMGAAIILIILCHTTVDLPNRPKLLNAVIYSQQINQAGVDIFLLLSGLGLFMSKRQNPDWGLFYKKRFVRIIPAYLLVDALYGLFMILTGHSSVSEYLQNYSLVTFFTRGILAEWFIAAIIVLYLLFPLFYRIVNRSTRASLILMTAIYAVSLGVQLWLKSYMYKGADIVNMIFIVRIPVFIAGMIVGKLISTGKTKLKCGVGIAVAVLAVALALCILNIAKNSVCKWWVTRLLSAPIAISLVALISEILSACSYLSRHPLSSFLRFFGGITLELYLIHVKVQAVILMYFGSYVGTPVTWLLINTSIVCISIIASMVVSKLLAPLTEKK